MVEEINSDADNDNSSNDSFQDEQLDVIYSCLRCDTKAVSYTHLTLPTILLV